ncbi:MAG: Spy/CpxP family protein refolding chaperone [Sulfuritalea sp.]|nr:Spy/CpxP family protein refolding chaperone [Sulfuritalea sp.]
MKHTRKILAGLLVAAGFSGLAIGQPGVGMRGGCDGSGPMGRHAAMKFDPAERAEQRLDYVKYQLKITAAQEPLWQAFADRAKAEAGKGFQAMRELAADEKLSAPERMAKKQALMQGRIDAMAGVHERFDRLYATLTPEQKKVADQHVGRLGPGGMGGGRMGPGPGRMAPQG